MENIETYAQISGNFQKLCKVPKKESRVSPPNLNQAMSFQKECFWENMGLLFWGSLTNEVLGTRA